MGGRAGVGWARAIAGAVAVVTVGLGGALGAGGQVEAQEQRGFRLTASTVYRVDPAVPAVQVEATYRMTNTTPDRDLGGGRVRYFYYDGVVLPIDDAIADLTVTVNDRDVRFTVDEDENGFAFVEIAFNSDLRYNRTATIVMRYRIVGAPPRTDDSFIRVNPAYVSFPVYSYADEGRGSVRVELPQDWTPDWVGSEFDDVRTEGGVVVFESVDIAEPESFGMLFTARQDDRLESTPLTVGTSQFEIRAWPGDAAWLEFADRSITEGVPVLVDLVGTPWPETAETDVIQASTPYLRGYAGFYDAESDVIEVGERLDLHTMLHELSHAWFNRSTISDRWLSEGLADEVGARAVAALGEPLPAPEDYDGPDAPIDVEPFPLNSWQQPFGAADDDEYYGYRTSFVVLRSLWDEVGDERMTELITAVLAGDRAYPSERGRADAGAVSWQEFLDLAEQVGGATGVEQLYREYVITGSQEDQLDRRTAVLVDYRALDERGAGWSPPESVRAAMAAWRFTIAGEQIAEAGRALDRRDELVSVLAAVGLEPADAMEAAYEDADDLEPVVSELDEQVQAGIRLVAARESLDDDLTALDLDVPPLTQDDYEAAPVAVATTAESLAAQAAEAVAAHTDLVDTLEPFRLRMPPLSPGAFVESPADVIASLSADRTAARDVSDAMAAEVEADSLLERIGAIGGDVDAQLVDAADRLADGDRDGASTSAAAALADIDGWRERGMARLVAVGLGVAIGVLAAWVAARIRRRRAARKADLGSDPVESTAREPVTSVEFEGSTPLDSSGGSGIGASVASGTALLTAPPLVSAPPDPAGASAATGGDGGADVIDALDVPAPDPPGPAEGV
jgi:hypothetical protein